MGDCNSTLNQLSEQIELGEEKRNEQTKKTKDINIGKEEIKLLFFLKDMVV